MASVCGVSLVAWWLALLNLVDKEALLPLRGLGLELFLLFEEEQAFTDADGLDDI